MGKIFKIENKEWQDVALWNDPVAATLTQLCIEADGNHLTENYNLFSKTVKKGVVVSAYPLAMWFIHSWWRIFYDVYSEEKHHNMLWRLSHEIASANEGFVWPRIAFVSDLKEIHIFSQAYYEDGQSVRYLNSLTGSVKIPFQTFALAIDAFIKETIDRLSDLGVAHDLSDFFSILQEERNNDEATLYRKTEAQMGFDPDEAAESLIKGVIKYISEVGSHSLDEMNVAFQDKVLQKINYFKQTNGVPANPQKICETSLRYYKPWEQAYQDAVAVRNNIGMPQGTLGDDILYELLGVAKRYHHQWDNAILIDTNASVSLYKDNNQRHFFPRKRHPHAKRFEMARFIGDSCLVQDTSWFVLSDLRTARQKYQKAFAAELLCPIDDLVERLNGRFNDDAIEEVAQYYNVSSILVESQLENHRYLPRSKTYLYAFS